MRRREKAQAPCVDESKVRLFKSRQKTILSCFSHLWFGMSFFSFLSPGGGRSRPLSRPGECHPGSGPWLSTSRPHTPSISSLTLFIVSSSTRQPCPYIQETPLYKENEERHVRMSNEHHQYQRTVYARELPPAYPSIYKKRCGAPLRSLSASLPCRVFGAMVASMRRIPYAQTAPRVVEWFSSRSL